MIDVFSHLNVLVPGGTSTLRGIQSQFGLLKGTHFLRSFLFLKKMHVFFQQESETPSTKETGGEMRNVKRFVKLSGLKRCCLLRCEC